MRNLIAAIALVIFLVGCTVGGVTLIDPDRLGPPKIVTTFELKSKISTIQLYGVVNAKQEEGLLEGKYTSVKEDAEGVYYQGNNKPVFLQHQSMNSALFYEGGIFVPKDINKNVRMFVYYSTKAQKPERSFGLIVDSLVAKEYGKMNVHREISDQIFNKIIREQTHSINK